MTTLRRFMLLALAVLAVGACSSGAAPSVQAPTIPTTAPAPTSDPNAPVAPDDPTGGRVVIPKPGQLDVHPIAAQTLTAEVNGRRVVVSVAYTSGVEPCYVLNSIVVRTGPSSFEVTLREGHGPGDVACIEIAEFKKAIVDLGDLQPGTYQISDGAGGAAAISVTVV